MLLFIKDYMKINQEKRKETSGDAESANSSWDRKRKSKSGNSRANGDSECANSCWDRKA